MVQLLLYAYPSEFVDYISNIVKSQNQSTAYNDWFTSYKEQADIQINDMPEDVPYNLDMTQYESTDENSDSSSDTSTEGTTEEGTTDSGETTTDSSTEGDTGTTQEGSGESTSESTEGQ